MKALACALLLVLPGCSALLGEPERAQHCYHRPSGERRCFADERALSADVRREQLAVVRAVEEQARLRALAVVAERDAREAAERARTAVERSDRIQDDAFDVLVELRENARESAKPAPESTP